MFGSEVPPWGTTVFDGGQFDGALPGAATEALPAATAAGGFEPDGAEPVAAESVSEAAGAQLAGSTFLLCFGRLAGGRFEPEGAWSDAAGAGFDEAAGFCAAGVVP